MCVDIFAPLKTLTPCLESREAVAIDSRLWNPKDTADTAEDAAEDTSEDKAEEAAEDAAAEASKTEGVFPRVSINKARRSSG